jgi:AcrR family transcriptional regulator
MSPRKPAVLRDRDGENLREHLIATAARLIDQRGSAGLAVRDIAREAQVADGALYNYFEDKEDLLAQALLAHVARVMNEAPHLVPEPGTGTVAENLASFIDRGLAVLIRVVPAFAGLLAQPKVLSRFHAMVGGGAAFGTPGADDGPAEPRSAEPRSAEPGQAGLPDLLTRYLHEEQRLGRIDAEVDVEAVSTLIVGAIHGQVLPRVVFATPGEPITFPSGLAEQLAGAAMRGLAPR